MSELWRLCLCLHWATESSDETFFSYYHLQIVSMEFVVYEWFIETKYTVVYFPIINIKDGGVYQWYMMFGNKVQSVLWNRDFQYKTLKGGEQGWGIGERHGIILALGETLYTWQYVIKLTILFVGKILKKIFLKLRIFWCKDFNLGWNV